MELRPYQEDAVRSIFSEWQEGRRHTLLVLPTGAGKTICFSKVVEKCVEHGERVLILAHREELLEQAADKIKRSTGLECVLEKASSSCIGSSLPVVTGSVQSLTQERRLEKFSNDYFDTIIVDEAHHCVSASYQKILTHFDSAKVLGVTATADRSDKKNLASFFDSLAYEYSLKTAISDGYLCSIAAKTMPLEIDMNAVKVSVGDFEVNSIAAALEPYLPKIAESIMTHAAGRKTVVFCPLISIAQELAGMIPGAKEVNGNSPDRKETLEWFDRADRGAVLCNAMLLTEGWDCPSCDCVVVLRPTKVRSLYCQMIGRGTRLSPGKENLLILDFLWMSYRHNLCKPASLVSENDEDIERVTKTTVTDEEIDLLGAVSDAEEARRNALAEALEKQQRKKSKLINPLELFSILDDIGMADYEPVFKWEQADATDKQIAALQRFGVDADGMTKGYACAIMDKLIGRANENLASVRQIKTLQKFGYKDVNRWTFDQASRKISALAAVGWKRWKLHD